jgi:hypothetical protein
MLIHSRCQYRHSNTTLHRNIFVCTTGVIAMIAMVSQDRTFVPLFRRQYFLKQVCDLVVIIIQIIWYNSDVFLCIAMSI